MKTNGINPLYLNFSNLNGNFEEINKNNYLTLVPTNENKDITTKHDKYEDFVRFI